MKVIRASAMGYCAGVRRAMEIALKETAYGLPVFTQGRLIHNLTALESLKERGVRELDDNPHGIIDGTTVVLRAHGVPPAREAELSARGARIADATCPKVKKNQLKIQSLAKDGFRVFLVGEKTHAEIVGLMGYADCIVVENAEEARRSAERLFNENPHSKTAVMGQTTLSTDVYLSATEAIKDIFSDVCVIDTICPATKDRQDAVKKLCASVDAVVIVGGKKSANTRRLFHIAKASGKAVYFIETAKELPPSVFTYDIVGISAGASTPDEIIDEVENRLLRKEECQ
ncbi:MAG: 4-hydroxy-3-methylbut-2-enyl diphosphate reductase [Treponema sp.]|nr:4-hydroxy-3-methylbut-2-enyl diphosphate reductase [Treponema sp.]